MIPIFIGFDKREAVAYHVCQQSIIENCSRPDLLSFHAVTGERRDGSNDFIYSRFLVPYRMGYKGWAIFMDGDMVVRGDICDLWARRSLLTGVQVVKHEDYETRFPVKYLGAPNENYHRKNWSSVILWNCGFFPNRKLTPKYVADATGSHLHRFEWLEDEEVGNLPSGWNRLVLEQDVQESDSLLHYTIGTPCFDEYAKCDRSEEWHAVYKRMTAPMET